MWIFLFVIMVMGSSDQTAAKTANSIVDRLQLRDSVFSLSQRVNSFHEIFSLDPDTLSADEKTALGFISGFMMHQVDRGRPYQEAEDLFTRNFLTYANSDP